MALEAVTFPPYPFGYDCKDMKIIEFVDRNWDSSPEMCVSDPDHRQVTPEVSGGRRKRRRSNSHRNKEDIENQRITHIAVERNRRKQMNDYLNVLRSLMPPSYVQRGDQASIVGGAINFVKELEQFLQSMESMKRNQQQCENGTPFVDFFSFPQYTRGNNSTAANESTVADIEVTMVDSHANLKILSKKKPRQLLKLVHGFQSLRLCILHLNVTTIDQTVLYSVSAKVEEGCELKNVDEIATAVNQMLSRIQEETNFS